MLTGLVESLVCFIDRFLQEVRGYTGAVIADWPLWAVPPGRLYDEIGIASDMN